ncbi:MAG: DUF4097 domain-containing protein [Gammaproteobacteria bacterium]|nr:DUF4097 domain-containing protein [Gammaproteobacteria bacterium]NNF60471.1 DUF4097 family beta strand repeat protein [Gammaproteobacteria bacterium]
MKAYFFLPLLLLATSVAGAGAINEEAAMPANGRLKVSNVSGSVEIYGWSRNRIEVTGDLGNESELVFSVDGSSATVEVESEGKGWGDRSRTDLVIRVPKSTRVNASTVSANLLVEEIEGELRLQTVSGDLDAQSFGQEVEARAVSGEVTVTGNGKVSMFAFKTVSGDIEATGLAGEIIAASVSGDIELESGQTSRLKLNTVSGDMDFSGAMARNAKVDAESVSGDVDLRLDSLYDTDYYLESFSGNISPVLGQKAQKKSKYAPGSRLELIEGNGDNRVRIETMSGDISIRETGNPRRKPEVQTSSRDVMQPRG